MKVGDLVRYKRTGRLHVIIDRFGWPDEGPRRIMLKLFGFPSNRVFRGEEVEIVRESD